MEHAPVSVVIPAFNAGKWIVETIESVLSQSTPPAQVIVVDDGSTDDTLERLRRFASRVICLRQANQGVSAARNRGVSASDAEFVAFLDADDIWHPRKLELQLATFAARPELGLLRTLAFDWPAPAIPTLGPPDGRRTALVTWESLAVKNRLITSSVVCRRRYLVTAGEFDTRLQGPEDRDLWLRIARLAPVANLMSPLTGYRAVPDSVSRQAARCHDGMRRILRKLDESRQWRGRWLLRRNAYGYMNHSCAYIYGASGHQWAALLSSLRSFAWYPLPLDRDETSTPYERPKRLMLTLLRAVRARNREGERSRPDSRNLELVGPASPAGGCTNA